MIEFAELTVAQQRWVSLIQHFYPNIYSAGKITYQELIMAHANFISMREQNKKYKVGWPIWLIMNNAISRGVYKIPSSDVKIVEVSDNPLSAGYEDSLKEFGLV